MVHRKSMNEIVELASFTLSSIAHRADKHFSGLGIIVYSGESFGYSYYTSLRPGVPFQRGLHLGNDACIEMLLKTSNIQNTLHDGFVLFNSEGKLTHVAQYLFWKPVKWIVPSDRYGTRYMSALYGSFHRSVVIAAIVTHDRRCFIFRRGKTLEIDVNAAIKTGGAAYDFSSFE